MTSRPRKAIARAPMDEMPLKLSRLECEALLEAVFQASTFKVDNGIALTRAFYSAVDKLKLVTGAAE